MRRPRPPAPPPTPRWSPCPEERQGGVCPLASVGAVANLVFPTKGCSACGRRPEVPVGSAVFELTCRTMHWTCRCGSAQRLGYPELADHHVCAAIRWGADVVRDDHLARVTASVLEARLAASP